ncbi:MAG: alpha/beta fold hydrolase [Acidimicrobiia bacterium]
MSKCVLVHGAFRGSWAWNRVVHELSSRDVNAVAIDLRGGQPSMSDWVADVIRAVEPGDVVVGHSMGGVVARAAARWPLVSRVVLIDAPVIESGQRAVDVSGPPPTSLPPRSTDIPATPVGETNGFDASLAAWVNDRLSPTPFGPSLDAVEVDERVPLSVAFCSLTPEFFPSVASRRRFEAEGRGYETITSHHDAPLLAPIAVADFIARAASQDRT